MTNALKRMRGITVAAALVLASAPGYAQESKSAPLASELASLLDQLKTDSIAARYPGESDQFVGALYFPGSQLLVVTAKYQAPQLLEEKLASKSHRDVYIDLNSASVPNTRVFVSDLGIDGLRPRRSDNQPFDTIEMHGKNWNFDGDWRKAKVSEDEYMKAFQEADEEYAKMLQALLGELKKTS